MFMHILYKFIDVVMYKIHVIYIKIYKIFKQ